MQIRGRGGEEKPKSQPAPKESPNSLQSFQVARIIDVISSGECGGLVNDLQSVFLDDTPLKNADGTFNFEGIEVATRLGSADQSYVTGFPSAENEVSVGVEVLFTHPITRTISTPDLDAIRVTIRFPSLVKQDNSGNLLATSVRMTVEVRPAGGTFIKPVDHTVTGKQTSPYEESYRINLPGVAPWDVRVTRLTADATIKINSKSIFARYTEIVDQKFSYPNSAYLAITVLARQFGTTIPRRAYEWFGRKIRIPSNYDVVTEVYSGIWDGTFQIAVSGNNSWVLYDLITSKMDGLGIDTKYIDKWSFYEAGQWCDEKIDNGLGGLRKRYVFNGVLNSQEDGYQVAQHVAGTFRGIIYWSASLVVLAVDRPRDPVKLLAPANVVDGIFHYSSNSIQSMSSVVQVIWNDPGDAYRSSLELVEDPDLIEQIGWKPFRLPALGCTDRAQAIAAGRWWLETQRSGRKTVSYVGGYDQVDIQPGDVVSISDPLATGIRAGGRVLQASANHVVIDQALFLQQGVNYRIAFAAEVARVEASDIGSSEVGSCITSVTTNFIDRAFKIGQSIIVSGFSSREMTATFRIHGVEAHKLTVSPNVSTEPAGLAIKIVARAIAEKIISESDITQVPLALTGNLLLDHGDQLTWSQATSNRPEGDTVSLVFTTPIVTALIPPGTVWVLSSIENAEWMVLGRTEMAPNLFQVFGVSYDGTKWDRIEKGIVISPEPTFAIGHGSLIPPSELNATEYLVRTGLGIAAKVTLSWTASLDPRAFYYEVEITRPELTSGWARLGVIGGLSIDISDISGGVYKFRVRARDTAGVASQWVTIERYLLGQSAPPDSPTNITSAIIGTQLVLKWGVPAALDLAGYELRYSPSLTASWASSVVAIAMIPGQASSVQVEARNGSWLLKSIDFFGSRSDEPAIVVIETATASSINIVEELSEGPFYSGVHSGTQVINGRLELASATTISSWASLASVISMSGFGHTLDGTYAFSGLVDLGDSFHCNIFPNIQTELINFDNFIVSWQSLVDVHSLAGVRGDEGEVWVEISVDGDPWQRLQISDYLGRTFMFRARLTSTVLTITPSVIFLSVVIDMPDRIISGQDIPVGTVGSNIVFDLPFYGSRPVVLVDSQDMQTGDWKSITNISGAGFTVQFFNSVGASVSRTCDYVAKGYGQKRAA